MGIPLTELSSAACGIFNCLGLMCRSGLYLWKLGELRLDRFILLFQAVPCRGVDYGGQRTQISSEGLVPLCLVHFKDFFFFTSVCVRMCGLCIQIHNRFVGNQIKILSASQVTSATGHHFGATACHLRLSPLLSLSTPRRSSPAPIGQ